MGLNSFFSPVFAPAGGEIFSPSGRCSPFPESGLTLIAWPVRCRNWKKTDWFPVEISQNSAKVFLYFAFHLRKPADFTWILQKSYCFMVSHCPKNRYTQHCQKDKHQKMKQEMELQ